MSFVKPFLGLLPLCFPVPVLMRRVADHCPNTQRNAGGRGTRFWNDAMLRYMGVIRKLRCVEKCTIEGGSAALCSLNTRTVLACVRCVIERSHRVREGGNALVSGRGELDRKDKDDTTRCQIMLEWYVWYGLRAGLT